MQRPVLYGVAREGRRHVNGYATRRVAVVTSETPDAAVLFGEARNLVFE